jgi:outer membrane protein OmpA-like peptidoglycan-associated protein
MELNRLEYFSVVIFLCLLLAAIPVYAQDSDQEPVGFSSWFIQGAGHYYLPVTFPPDLLSGVIDKNLGVRGAFGYEWQRGLRLFFSSGYSWFDGTNPLVTDFSFVPVTIGIGYARPIWRNIGIQADVGGGVQLLQASHYETWLNWAGNQPSESPRPKPFGEVRFYGTYSPFKFTSLKFMPLKFMRIYAGGGADVVFEMSKAPVVFPVLQAGAFVPLILKQPPPPPPPPPIPEGEFVVKFKENSGKEIVEGDNELDKVGELLKANPHARLVLEGHSAPHDTDGGRITVSAARVWYCVEYLNKKGIPDKRMRMAFFGVEAPEMTTLRDAERRCVKLFFESLGDPPRPEELSKRPKENNGGDTNRWTIPITRRVYFDEGIGTEIRDENPLRQACELLKANPQMHVTLKGFATPSGTKGGQITRSAARVWSCVEFLRGKGIPEERMHMAFSEADKMSKAEKANPNLRRRVEIITHELPAVYFEAGSGTKIIDNAHLLRQVGNWLQKHPELYVTLRGYDTSSRTVERQRTRSTALVSSCMDYLTSMYGIDEEQMRVFPFNAGETSKAKGWNLRERVEIIIEEPRKQEIVK